MPAGSLVGALAVTQLADRIGRKRTVILAGIIWVIGSILQCASVVSLRSSQLSHVPSRLLTLHNLWLGNMQLTTAHFF